MRSLFFVALATLLLSGCVQDQLAPKIEDYKFNYDNASYEDADVVASIKYVDCGHALGIYGCAGYSLIIRNKSSSDIFLDWNKTSFISGETTNGGFMYEGVVYRDRNLPKPDDVIFSGATIGKSIWPNSLVELIDLSWRNKYIPLNPNGVYLVLRTASGVEKRIKLTATVNYQGKL